jgi:hypothetical protein
MYVLCSQPCPSFLLFLTWTGHVARKGAKIMHVEFCQGSLEERDHLEDLAVGGSIRLIRSLNVK